jgi:hypothetical protein
MGNSLTELDVKQLIFVYNPPSISIIDRILSHVSDHATQMKSTKRRKGKKKKRFTRKIETY